jgi:hypothetical protein
MILKHLFVLAVLKSFIGHFTLYGFAGQHSFNFTLAIDQFMKQLLLLVVFI